MALTEIYVDPSIAGDSGNGLIGTPYGDLEYAIEQETFDTTNGTRVNILTGTDELLAAQIDTALADTSVSVAWTPAETAPLVFQGYTTAAGDGGIGGIQAATNTTLINTTRDWIHFVDLHLHGSGTANLMQLDDFSSIVRCECEFGTGSGVFVDDHCVVTESYIHGVGAANKYALNCGIGTLVSHNFVAPGTGFTIGQGITTAGSTILNNIVVTNTTGAMSGILISQGSAINNSVYSTLAGTGSGIFVQINGLVSNVTNNLIEGFSGTGGFGIGASTQTSLIVGGGNGAYDCETAFASPSEYTINDRGDDETLGASPFTSAATNDFNPVDTGNVKEGALPQIIGGGLV